MSLTTNLVSYWSCDEASGNALDAHGTNNLTDTGGIGSATGKIGNARSFPNNGAKWLSHSDNADLSTGDIDFTFSFWFNLTSQTTTRTILCKGQSDTTTHEYTAFLFGGALFFRVQNSAATVSVGSLSNGVWYHGVGWHDSVNNQIGVTLNAGTPVTASYSGGVTDSTDMFILGADQTGSRPMDGLIDEIGFWKRVLTSQDRTDLYNSGNGFAYPFSSSPTLTPWFNTSDPSLQLAKRNVLLPY